jgi:hypothetical protein
VHTGWLIMVKLFFMAGWGNEGATNWEGWLKKVTPLLSWLVTTILFLQTI